MALAFQKPTVPATWVARVAEKTSPSLSLPTPVAVAPRQQAEAWAVWAWVSDVAQVSPARMSHAARWLRRASGGGCGTGFGLFDFDAGDE